MTLLRIDGPLKWARDRAKSLWATRSPKLFLEVRQFRAILVRDMPSAPPARKGRWPIPPARLVFRLQRLNISPPGGCHGIDFVFESVVGATGEAEQCVESHHDSDKECAHYDCFDRIL